MIRSGCRELDDAARLVHHGRAEAGDLLLGAWFDSDGDVGIGVEVVVQHLAVVHAVHVVAGQNQDVLASHLADHVDVVAHRVGRPLEPGVAGGRLLGGEDLDIAGGKRVEPVGPPDVAVERDRVELGQHVHPLHMRVDGVGDGDVDQAVLGGDGDCRLAAIHRQGIEPGSPPSTEDQDRHVVCEIFHPWHRHHPSQNAVSP